MNALRHHLDESRAAAAFRRAVDTEALMWAAGLLLHAASNPASDFHFTLFWPQWVFGIQSPGFGLGHSIGYLFRGDIQSSLNSHLLGVPIVAVLIWRIVTLQYRKLKWKARVDMRVDI